MVVDDNPDILYAVKQGLNQLDAKYRVICVDSGEKCFELLKNHEIPDVILLEIMMPDMSGWEIFDRLKENQSWKDIPIVFLTIRTDRTAKNAGSFLGDDYIEKPFEITELKKRIDKILKINELSNKEEEQMTKKVMVVDDEYDLREMVSTTLKKEGFEIEVAENGFEFLDKVDVFQPDLVTLDVMMPGLITPEIFKKLKKKENNKTKIIMLTIVRFSNEEKEKTFKMANVVDYITKPFELEYFIDAVKKHVQ